MSPSVKLPASVEPSHDFQTADEPSVAVSEQLNKADGGAEDNAEVKHMQSSNMASDLHPINEENVS